MKPIVIERWHEMVKLKKFDGFKTLLADDAVLYSPSSKKAVEGKSEVYKRLTFVNEVLNNTNFIYVNEWYSHKSAVLEFETVINDTWINGVDIIAWNEKNQITEIKVMIRPLKALNKLIEAMNQAMQESL